MDNIYQFTLDKFRCDGKRLPQDLKDLVEKFQNARDLLADQPLDIKERLIPLLNKASAIIAFELEEEYGVSKNDAIDKRKKLELEAKALELLQKQYKMRK